MKRADVGKRRLATPERRPVLVRFLALAAIVFRPTSVVAQSVDDLLTRGDTSAAIALLRSEDRSPAASCRLATLLTHLSTSDQSTWRLRAEAAELFNRALAVDPEPLCYLAFALLRQKQGSRIEARRMIGRAEALLRDRPALATPSVIAKMLYRRAILVDDWLRNFDFLVNAPNLPVSTPSCIYYGFFCENFTRPQSFHDRLASAPSMAAAVRDERLGIRRLLDSVLRLDPGHVDARRLLLRRLAVEQDWGVFRDVAADGVRRNPRSVAALLALIAAAVRDQAYHEADSLLARIDSLLPASLRGDFERIEAVGAREASAAAAVWRLSDPFYLTHMNERRVQHYGRLAIADIVFTDPDRRIRGRDTQPGRLILRYGWPRHIWEVRRDGELELDPEQMRLAFQLMSCWGPACVMAVERAAQQVSPRGDGRWTFFNYDRAMPSFIFERNLSERTYRYKIVTMTEQLDSAIARVLPSGFDTPYPGGEMSAMITRFPRPGGPALEIASRFTWPDSAAAHRDVRVGIAVHELVQGRLVNRALGQRAGSGAVTLVGAIPVIWGPLQVSAEAMVEKGPAGFARTALRVSDPAGRLTVSDLLFGTGASAEADLDARSDVRMTLRTDSLPAPGDVLALYWEVYELTPDPERTWRYRVTLNIEAVSGGRAPAAELLRLFGRAMGVAGTADISWQRERLAGLPYAPEVVEVRLPGSPGSYRVRVEITDLVSGRRTASARVITLTPPP